MDHDGVILGVSVVVSPPHILLLAPFVLAPLLLKGADHHDGLFAPDHQVGVLALQGHQGHVAPRAVLAVLHRGDAAVPSLTQITLFTHSSCTCGYLLERRWQNDCKKFCITDEFQFWATIPCGMS